MRTAYPLTLVVFVAALAGCGSSRPVAEPLDPSQERAVQFQDAAYAAYEAREYEQAARLYGRALDHARTSDDAAAIADAAYNRAACYTLLERWTEADADLTEALLRSSSAVARADILLLRASVLRRLERPADAESAISEALTESRINRPLSRHVFAADILRGHLACDEKQYKAAAAFAERAEASAAGSFLATKALFARIVDGRDAPGEAAPVYDLEADLAREAGRYRQMARALADAGRDYGEAGVWKLAADRHYRSARAYLSQKATPAAQKQADAARDAAQHIDNPSLSSAISRLSEELGVAP